METLNGSLNFYDIFVIYSDNTQCKCMHMETASRNTLISLRCCAGDSKCQVPAGNDEREIITVALLTLLLYMYNKYMGGR